MTIRSVLFLLIFTVMIVPSETSFALDIENINTANSILQWQNFSMSTCRNQSMIEVTITPTTTVRPMFECEDKNFIGLDCNIPFVQCQISPDLQCENGGTCYSNNSFPLKYYCECQPGFSGDRCEKDERTCKTNTCWHDGSCLEIHEIISLVNKTTFDCNCQDGYDGAHCELLENLCWNITCQNGGACKLSFLSWSCVCTSMYSGMYCQDKSTKLAIREFLSKSFAYIAITAITAVFVFVIVMDIMKYIFKIDPVDRERRLIMLEQQKRQKKKNRRKKPRKNAVHTFYVA